MNGNLIKFAPVFISLWLATAAPVFAEFANENLQKSSQVLGQELLTDSSADRRAAIIAILNTRVMNSDGRAAAILSELYAAGEIVPKNDVESLRFLKEAANFGDPGAKVKYGQRLIKGDGFPSNPDEGLKLIKEVADTGNAGALFTLGDVFTRGGAVPIDGVKAINLLKQSAEAGNTGALLRLGELYRDGKVVDRDYSEAIVLLTKAVQSGNVAAKVSLGQMLMSGYGVQQSVDQGIALLLEASEAGNANASTILGDIYSRGTLKPVDAEKALSFFERSAAAGNDAAFLRMGDIYRDGTGVPVNAERAIVFYTKAVDAGETRGLLRLGSGHVNKVFGRLSNANKGFEFLSLASEKGIPEAAVAASSAYLNGISTKKDITKSLRILNDASEKGNQLAAAALISIYRDGRGKDIKKDSKKAASLLAKYRSIMDDDFLKMEDFLSGVSASSSTSDYRRYYNSFELMSSDRRTVAIKQIRTANPNFYVYVMQSKMKANSFYRGEIDGQISSLTVRAINAYCKSIGKIEDCKYGPMSWRTANVLALNM